MPYTLYDFEDNRGINRMTEWAKGQPSAQLGKLNNRLDRLEQADGELVEQLIAGAGEPSIYKIKIQGNPKLRPMLCRGPINMHVEFTLLVGAREIQGELVPPASEAVSKRNLVMSTQKFRCPHVRFEI